MLLGTPLHPLIHVANIFATPFDFIIATMALKKFVSMCKFSFL
jgi:hypothetical protein